MSATRTVRSMSRTILSRGCIALVAIALIWFAVIAWWETSARAVDAADILLYLLLLPAAILALAGWLYARLSSRGKRARQPSVLAPAAAAEIQPLPPESSDAAAPVLPILAAWVATMLGSEGSELVNQLALRRLRPVPDELLTDAEGFPPLTGRVREIDTEPVVQILAQSCTDGMPAGFTGAGEMRDALLRALALLESVLQQAAQEWPLDTAAGGTAQSARNDSATLRGCAGVSWNDTPPLNLQIKLILSDALTPSERELARAFTGQRLLALGICASRQPVEAVAATDDATALKLLDGFRADACGAAGAHMPQALLLLACDSALCPAVIDDWEIQGRLFAAHHPNGRMPGEAACAILCANEPARQAAATTPLCCLAPARTAGRDAGSDRTTAHACLAGVIGEALSAGSTAGDAIRTVVCDADHRTGVTLESIAAMLDRMPRLDAIEDRLAVGETCGHLGAASMAAVLAAAAHHTSATSGPVLVFNVSHASERSAAVLLPADADGAEAQTQPLPAA